MGRSRYPSEDGMNRGAWSGQEDKMLVDYITTHGEGRWRSVPMKAGKSSTPTHGVPVSAEQRLIRGSLCIYKGLNRCGRSCRLRWLNYLRPNIKRGNISADEEDLIIRLHRLLGNRCAFSCFSVYCMVSTHLW